MTNREWLESLSDEELAKELDKDCKHFCKRFDAQVKCFKSYEECVKGRLEWLQAEHKEKED